MVSHANQADFQERVIVTSHQRPVLVDFWATWCGPCQSLAPILESLSESLAGKLDVVKVDTDAEAEVAAEYGIRSLPTLILFRDGQSVGQLVGAQPLSAIEELVDPWLPKASDDDLDLARQAIDGGEHTAAVKHLESALALEATDYRIHPLLAATYLELGRVDAAEAMIASLPANIAVDDIYDGIRARIRMSAGGGNVDPKDEVSVAFAAAMSAAAANDYDSAVSALLGLLPAQRAWNDGAVRTALLDIFNVLGSDPRVREWRTKMARSLN